MSHDRVLATIDVCHAFPRIGARPSAEGYMAERFCDGPSWQGQCRVVQRDTECRIRLENPDGSLFDSSRYFVLRVEKGSKRAYIGLGFNERSHAFDFKDALDRHQQSLELARAAEELQAQPARDFSMEDGERIRVNLRVKTKKTVRDGNPSAAPSTTTATTRRRRKRGGFSLSLDPQPSAPPRQTQPVATRTTSTSSSTQQTEDSSTSDGGDGLLLRF